MTEYSKRFLQYHDENPNVWQLFERFALQAIKAGRVRFSANAIFERIRWYTSVDTQGDEFKMNNNYRADYARKFIEKYPEHAAFFQTRERKACDIVDIKKTAPSSAVFDGNKAIQQGLFV